MLPYSEWVCAGCHKQQGDVDVEERHSLGIYAGRWCDECWKRSGYRDEDAGAFDPMDAGESYDAD